MNDIMFIATFSLNSWLHARFKNIKQNWEQRCVKIWFVSVLDGEDDVPRDVRMSKRVSLMRLQQFIDLWSSSSSIGGEFHSGCVAYKL